MSITIREVEPRERAALMPLLLLAEPSAPALRWSLANLSDKLYRMDVDGQLVGAASLRWQAEPAEIVELAIAAERQGQGFGKRLVLWLIDEARRRGTRQLIVGTPNASIGNIVFYQRCGFRMDHVRRDYFWYYEHELGEYGIPIRDMLVFRYDLAAEEESQTA